MYAPINPEQATATTKAKSAGLEILTAARVYNNQRPSGVVISVPDGGVNSNVDAGIGARVWFE